MAVESDSRGSGSRKNPIWRIVVADRRSPRDGRTIETIGHYNPQTDPSTIVIDEDRARHWLDHGAQPTRTVAGLLRTKGIEAVGSLMRDLVEFLARALVEDPDAVEVEEVEENGDLIVEVTVGGDDLGRLIGHGGRVANAIRTIAKAAATGADRRVLVEFVED